MRATGWTVAVAVALAGPSCSSGNSGSPDGGQDIRGQEEARLPLDLARGDFRDVAGDLLPLDVGPDAPDAPSPDAPDAPLPDGAAETMEQVAALDAGSEVAASCPPDMVLAAQAFCIDRFEAALEELGSDGKWLPAAPWYTVDDRTVRAVAAEGLVPQGYISGSQAEAACQASGKRLCTSQEWLAACQGPEEKTWPYGNAHQPGACNDDYPNHPVVELFGTSDGIWDAQHMNDPGINQQLGTLSPAGAHPLCVSDWGAFDMHGNLHEWVADADGTFRGGFYADGAINGPGCTYVTTAHDASYHDYSTGFRCCLTP